MKRSGLLVVTLCALLAATCAAEPVGQPRNLTVQTVAADDDGDDFLGPDTAIKLNVSWLPPETGRTPKFYSVLVTSVTGNGTAGGRRGSGSCTEGSVYHVTGDSEETWIALPENRFGAASETALELEIEPACSYRVQVFANPRNSANDTEDATSVVYTVPECVGGRCNCDRALEELPVPEVTVKNFHNNSILIIWKVEQQSSRSQVKSSKISVGIPHLTSSSGLIVYNKTQIFTGTSDENLFIWHEDRLKKGTKIFVTVQDSYGCSGKEGTYTIKRVRHDTFYRKNITAIIFAAIIVVCVLFSGLISFVKRYTEKHNYALLGFKKKPPKQLTTILQSTRIDALLKNHNVLYVEQEIEEARRKDLADEHELSYARLRVVRELGQGQFGRVYLADLLGDEGPRPVAVKTSLTSLNSARAQLEVRQQLLEEIKITKVAGSHPHLVGLVGCCTLPDNPVCLVLEHMPGGDLLGYLHRMRDATEARDSAHEVASLESPGINSIAETTCTSLGSQSPGTPTSRVFFANEFKLEYAASCESEGAISHAEMMRFALEIAKGMEHLEAKGIVHRDLAARNVLMDENLVLKISDFGLSRKGAYTLNGGGTRRLPIRWMPPEAIRRRAFTSKSDVWSYGLVLWEIGSLGDFPYPRLSDDELLSHLLEEGGRPLAHEARFAPGEARELMDMCWAAKSERRPDFRQVVLWLEGRLRDDTKCNPAYRELCGNEGGE